ncbi:unnamed protein product [Heligmosomoides polygyrus]|uniref:BHLH domain-containing protein n=1 Tax=Heligmosomoides polygyrus TaxID=6339 RepID=A0A183FXW0_HELPZ|nr:unnamed protein product [Heligmosomoides polygyrus]
MQPKKLTWLGAPECPQEGYTSCDGAGENTIQTRSNVEKRERRRILESSMKGEARPSKSPPMLLVELCAAENLRENGV